MDAEKKKSRPVQLTPDSRITVRSVGSRDEVVETHGVFTGIVSVGAADGLAIKLGADHGDLAGKTRIIPSHVILTLDVIEPAEAEDEATEESHIHYS